jgi:hypothetical protein
MANKPSPWAKQDAQAREQEREINRALKLISEATDLLEKHNTIGWLESALWRLVDAAGILSIYAPIDAVGQEHNPTGLGFSLAKRFPAEK